MSKHIIDRQTPAVALVALTPADVAGGGAVVAIPRGSLVSLAAMVATAFNTSGTTPVATLTIKDGAATLVSAETVASTGKVTVDTDTKFYANGDELAITLAESADSGLVHATAGLVLVQVEYVQLGVGGTIME